MSTSTALGGLAAFFAFLAGAFGLASWLQEREEEQYEEEEYY